MMYCGKKKAFIIILSAVEIIAFIALDREISSSTINTFVDLSDIKFNCMVLIHK